MIQKTAKLITFIVVSILAVLILWGLWAFMAAPTRVAFLNYQVITLGQISKANDSRMVRLYELTPEEASRAGHYDILLINGMGLRITEEQRAQIQKAADRGLPVLSTMVTNPANDINTVDSTLAPELQAYLSNGGPANYRNMLAFIRRRIDRKVIAAPQPAPAEEYAVENIYHPSPDGSGGVEEGFRSIAAYNRWLKDNALWKEDAPRIIVTGQMGDPTDLIASLEATGNVVYPIRSTMPMLRTGQLDSIAPSAVINMAHGRLGDGMVRFLEKYNIPLFSPLNVNSLVSDWEADEMGMAGGFLSQSVVTPEIDGAIRPFVLFGHYEDEDGLQRLEAIPERLQEFTETVNRYLKLRRKPESQKKIAIFYYKGAGQNALTAAGMEVVPSLYNFLKALQSAGYNVEGLPSSPEALAALIQSRGAVFGSYAEGAASRFMDGGAPEWVDAPTFARWAQEALPQRLRDEVKALNGEFPGPYMSRDGRLALARIELGNVVLLPQPAAGGGQNDFQMVHGTHAAPPYNYIAAYLYARYGFGADAMVHFGTHGSLEFTPKKQVALSQYDWPDRLVGTVPHFYLYTISNVGEGVMAKRRAYATLQSYLTAPFMESNVRELYRDLSEELSHYEDALYGERPDAARAEDIALRIKGLTIEMGIASDLGLDTLDRSVPYTEEEVLRIGNFAEELASEKVTGRLYVMGEPYLPAQIESTVYAMSTEPVAYGLLGIDRARGKDVDGVEKQLSVFNRRYVAPAKQIVARLLAQGRPADDRQLCSIAGITPEELARAREVAASLQAPPDMMSMMAQMAGMQQLKKDSAAGRGMSEMMSAVGRQMMGGRKAQPTQAEKDFARAVTEMEQAVLNVYNYRRALLESPSTEIGSMLNALDGGYTSPSPGGDPVANPNTLPTGRNLFAVNAEATPTRSAWEKGVALAENTLRLYRQRHCDSLPRKVSYTLWSSEFIETEGATIAQIFYMLGVEPVYDSFGRVTDIRLIPSERLGRPRIDVVVQTSGQLRDIAASRLFLIDRAVRMAAEAQDGEYVNNVAEGIRETERILTEKGVTPADARRMSSYRVFGGVNGNYGTGIQGIVTASDRWASSSEIAQVYMNNMGAYYGSEEGWEEFSRYAFEAALSRTDAVVQPRQSNTWDALSLDHVYEFMGGLNLSVKEVTGKDPDAYLSDYRNRNRVRMQELKEAIGVESRTTIFNPSYIAEKLNGGAGDAAAIAETVTNTFGWNVMKPEAVDDRVWDEIYEVYVQDKFDLGVHEHFREVNPAALEEVTAVMLESVRKGLWDATPEQVADIAELHTGLIEEFAPSCSGFVCDNPALQDYIASALPEASASEYRGAIRQIREASVSDASDGMVLRKDRLQSETEKETTLVSNIAVAVLIIALFIGGGLLIRRRRKSSGI
ncbi:MAG TPA: cobaltochelatase subunit CobN [Candidatus Coprenecus merdigallinarum]|nr:cobaltochelatase subunit CobN [Candidatus Coprenecus merdigallinarum]